MELSIQSSTVGLPADIMERLSQLALSSGKSLKSYMESVLTDKATESDVSPSGDKWFDDPENMRIVMHGIEQARRGEGKTYTASQLSSRLGL